MLRAVVTVHTSEREALQFQTSRRAARFLLRAVCESPRQLSRRLFHFRRHFHGRHDLLPRVCLRALQEGPNPRQLAHGRGHLPLWFLAHSLRPLQRFFAQPLRVRRHLYNGRKIRPRSSPTTFFLVSSGFRCVQNRSTTGGRRRSDSRDLGRAPPSVSLERARYFSPHSLRSMRWRHLSFRLPFSFDILFLVRGSHRHSPAFLESPRLRPLSALDLFQLHSVPAELDHSVWLCHVLSGDTPSRAARIPHLRFLDSTCRRSDVRARCHRVAHWATPLFVYRLVGK